MCAINILHKLGHQQSEHGHPWLHLTQKQCIFAEEFFFNFFFTILNFKCIFTISIIFFNLSIYFNLFFNKFFKGKFFICEVASSLQGPELLSNLSLL